MSDPAVGLWSSNPNAPQIPRLLYTTEKEFFAGGLLSAILYGTVIGLFFRCLRALFNPTNHRNNGIWWGLVIYTTVMFLTITLCMAMYLDILSLSYVNDRDFPGGSTVPPGPFGFIPSLHTNPVFVVSDVTFVLNNVLANGLLLYRCYIIYSKSFMAIIVPCLIYLTSIALGIWSDYELSQNEYILGAAHASTSLRDTGTSFLSLSFALNMLLTLMIVIRLLLHNRKIQRSMGVSGTPYTTVASMMIESYTLYAASLLAFFIPWARGNSLLETFLLPLANVEVIAPFLIILRVANRRAFSENIPVARNSTHIETRNERDLSTSDGMVRGGYLSRWTGKDGKAPGELVIEIAKTIERHDDGV